VRHDMVHVPHAGGGPTSAANGSGLCEACNLAKEVPGWRAEVVHGTDRHTVATTTPTGHRYTSSSPPLPGGGRPGRAPASGPASITWFGDGCGPFDEWLRLRLAA
jgi:hypothetical protein